MDTAGSFPLPALPGLIRAREHWGTFPGALASSFRDHLFIDCEPILWLDCQELAAQPASPLWTLSDMAFSVLSLIDRDKIGLQLIGHRQLVVNPLGRRGRILSKLPL